MDKGPPVPKFGEWDVNDPAPNFEGFTGIFSCRVRDEKKTGGQLDSPAKADTNVKRGVELNKPPTKKWLCCVQPQAEP